MAEGGLRLDKYLWFTRFTKTRDQAREIADAGHLRIDGRPVARSHASVQVGNVLSFALRGRVRIIRVTALPPRRLSPVLALQCYKDLDPATTDAVDAGNVAP